MAQPHDDSIHLMRRDHERLLQMIDRILAECDQHGEPAECTACPPVRRAVCGSNIEQAIRHFVESTLRHNLFESTLMERHVPAAHRIAHQRAHIALAQQLKEIRTVFAHDGNGIVAIEGIDRVRQSLLAHFEEYDAVLEQHLNEAARPA